MATLAVAMLTRLARLFNPYRTNHTKVDIRIFLYYTGIDARITLIIA